MALTILSDRLRYLPKLLFGKFLSVHVGGEYFILIFQEGPQCGLVALSMASRLFGKDKHISPSFLMEEARKQEFTKVNFRGRIHLPFPFLISIFMIYV